MTVVPLVPGFQAVTATAINNHGDFAGYCSYGPGADEGFVSLHGRVFLVGTLPGQNASQVLALNDQGQAIGTAPDNSYRQGATGGSSITIGPARAFFWQEGRMVDLGDVTVSGIGESGQVLGSEYHPVTPLHPTPGDSMAFLWQNGQFSDLNTRIDAHSGWKLENATAVNTLGQIVGWGDYKGKEHAFLLTPITT